MLPPGASHDVAAGLRVETLLWPAWRPHPCGVHEGQNPHCFVLHLVHQPVAFVGDQLPRACNLTRFTKVRMLGQATRRFSKKLIHPDGGEGLSWLM